MLTRLELENFKCFEHLDLSFGPLTVLVGPNNSGKSSVLQAVEIFGVAAGDGGGYEIQLGEGKGDLDGFIRQGSDQLSVELHLLLLDTGTGNPETWECAWTRKREQASGTMRSEARRTRSDSMTPGNFQPPVGGWLKTLQRLSPDPETIRHGTPRETSVTHLGPRGEHLAGVLDYLLREHRERFDRLEVALAGAIPGVIRLNLPDVKVAQSDRTNLVGTHNVAGRGISFVERGGAKIPAAHASDGLLLFLAFLTVAFHPAPPNLLLVEEPENGIHPKNLQRVIDVLRGLTEGRFGAPPIQVILTTHSPYLLDFVKPEEVRVFQRDAKGLANAFPLDKAPRLREWLEDYSVGELWFNVGEERLAPGG